MTARRDFDRTTLLSAARDAMRAAHAPYSRFPVGAALLAEDGRVFTGCNVENAAYPLSMCAERVAIGKAVSEGATRFVAIAVTAERTRPVTPCGACRQVLAEFGEMTIVLDHPDTDWELSVTDLLPHGFSAASLEEV
jgi:cytidine deaminase